MRHWLRGLGVALRLEATTWVRTREVHLYLLLPSLLFMPIVGLITTIAVSIQTGPEVAVPTVLPPGLELAWYLERAGLTVVPSADPFAAWQAGRVDAAVVSVRTGAGIANARVQTEPLTDRPRYLVHAIAADDRTRGDLQEAIELAGDDALHGWIAMAGGEPDGAWLAKMLRVDLDDPGGDEADDDDDGVSGLVHQWVVKYLLGGVLLLGALVLPVQCVADRRAGVLEAMAATTTPVSALFAARVLVFSALQATAITGFVVSGWLLVGSGLGVAPGGWLLLDALEIVTGLCVGNALLLLPGLAASDAKGAMNWGSLAVFPLHGVLVVGALQVQVAGLPLLSAGIQGPWGLRLLGAVGTGWIAAALVWGWSRIFRGDRLLPPAGGVG